MSDVCFEPPPQADGEDLTVWEVIEEHLERLEYAVEDVERGLDDVAYALDDLASGPEARLAIHCDGLRVGGPPVAAWLVKERLPELRSQWPSEVAALCFALLAVGKLDALVASLLLHESQTVRRIACRACTLTQEAGLEASALQLLARVSRPRDQAALLDFLAERALAPAGLARWLQSESAEVQAAAARVLTMANIARSDALMDRLYEHPDERVREPALIAGLAAGSRRAFSTVEAMALAPRAHAPAAPSSFAAPPLAPLHTALYAALGGPEHHTRLARALGDSKRKAEILFALGYSGNVGLMPVLIEHLESERELESKIAAQAIATILGIDLQNDAFAMPPAKRPPAGKLPPPEEDPEAMESLPPLEEDDLEADLVPPPEAELPVPNVAAIRAHWDRVRGGLIPGKRYLAGKPYTPGIALEFLERAPMRRRHVVAQALRVRTGGKAVIDSRAFSATQREQIASCRKAPLREGVSFSAF